MFTPSLIKALILKKNRRTTLIKDCLPPIRKVSRQNNQKSNNQVKTFKKTFKVRAVGKLWKKIIIIHTAYKLCMKTNYYLWVRDCCECFVYKAEPSAEPSAVLENFEFLIRPASAINCKQNTN